MSAMAGLFGLAVQTLFRTGQKLWSASFCYSATCLDYVLPFGGTWFRYVVDTQLFMLHGSWGGFRTMVSDRSVEVSCLWKNPMKARNRQNRVSFLENGQKKHGIVKIVSVFWKMVGFEHEYGDFVLGIHGCR